MFLSSKIDSRCDVCHLATSATNGRYANTSQQLYSPSLHCTLIVHEYFNIVLVLYSFYDFLHYLRKIRSRFTTVSIVQQSLLFTIQETVLARPSPLQAHPPNKSPRNKDRPILSKIINLPSPPPSTHRYTHKYNHNSIHRSILEKGDLIL